MEIQRNKRRASVLLPVESILSLVQTLMYESLYDNDVDDDECEVIMYYDDVDDKIYTYSVRKSLSDPLLFKLNKLLNVPYSQFYHYDKLKTLYDELYKNHVKGWIMIRTKQLLGL